jgi:hypothetical protein
LHIVSVELDRKRGSAALTVGANRDGTVRVFQTKRIRGTEPVPIAADAETQVTVQPRGKAKRMLRRRGQLEANPRVLLETSDGNKTGERQRVTLALKRR